MTRDEERKQVRQQFLTPWLPLAKVRKTWKNSLSPEKNAARLEQMRFCKQVRKLLGDDYQVEFHFNPGGVAVWGETYVNIYKSGGHYCSDPRHGTPCIGSTTCDACTDECTHRHIRKGMPAVEACLSHDFSYIRQWDGSHSGNNIRITYDLYAAPQFADTVRSLAKRPFVRF